MWLMPVRSDGCASRASDILGRQAGHALIKFANPCPSGASNVTMAHIHQGNATTNGLPIVLLAPVGEPLTVSVIVAAPAAAVAAATPPLLLLPPPPQTPPLTLLLLNAACPWSSGRQRLSGLTMASCAMPACPMFAWMQEDSLPGGLPQFPAPGKSGDLVYE
jgi:hypothetical protein